VHIHFSHPLLLWPTAMLALFALVLGFWSQRRPGMGVRAIGQRPWLLGLGVSLMLMGAGIGLAEPRWGNPRVPRLTVHAALDASRSMLAMDMDGKSRWEAAKALLEDLASQAGPGINYSVNLITGDAIPLLPPGNDALLVRDALTAIEPGEIGSPGTGIGRCLEQITSWIYPDNPAIVLLLSDGEESLETDADSLSRANSALREARIPLYAILFGTPQKQAIPRFEPGLEKKDQNRGGAAFDEKPGADALVSNGADNDAVIETTARPDMLETLTRSNGGRVISAREAAFVIQGISEARERMPGSRTIVPAHPEWGAWLALIGLAIWLYSGGRPQRKWRLIFGIILFLQLNPARAKGLSSPPLPFLPPPLNMVNPLQATGLPIPPPVKAWLAQRALERNDLEAARRWRPTGDAPNYRLLAANIDLRTHNPENALNVLAPLTGQGAPRPLPTWRMPALLLAARAEMEMNRPERARCLLERALLESPGQPEAVHNLQSILKDPDNAPDTKQPPQSRPRQNAGQDETDGFRVRLPRKSGGGLDK
jgi:hypothetical protein